VFSEESRRKMSLAQKRRYNSWIECSVSITPEMVMKGIGKFI
jgi:hypothetical protein